MTEDGAQGPTTDFADHISDLRTASVQHDGIAIGFRRRMDLDDSSTIDIGTSGTSVSHDLQSDESDYSSDSTSSADFEYHGNSVLFSPLPTLSVAHTKTRPRLFAAKLAKQHQIVAASGGIQAPQPPGFPISSRSSSRSARSAPAFDTETHDSDKDLGERIGKFWIRLRKRRVTVLNILDELNEKRIQLQDARRRKSELERNIFQDLRLDLLEKHRNELEQRLQAAERAQFDVEEAEQAVESLTDDLNDAEREIEIMERRFYSQVLASDSALSTRDSISARPSRPPSRASLFGISRDRPDLVHPLYMQLREVFGNLQLAREDLHNLVFRRVAIESGDVQLDDDKVKFLETFPEHQRKAEEKIRQLTMEFDQLQAECQMRGVVPASIPFYEDEDGYKPIIRQLEDPALNLLNSAHSPSAEEPATLSNEIHPILLSNPKHVLQNPPLTTKQAVKKAVSMPKNDPGRAQAITEAIQEHGIDSLFSTGQPGNKFDYINRWLLHKMRTSAMEVEVLESVFDTVLKYIDGHQWQLDVLAFWARDEAAQMRSMSIASTVTSTPSDRRAPVTHSCAPTNAQPEFNTELSHVGSWDESEKTPLSEPTKQHLDHSLQITTAAANGHEDDKFCKTPKASSLDGQNIDSATKLALDTRDETETLRPRRRASFEIPAERASSTSDSEHLMFHTPNDSPNLMQTLQSTAMLTGDL
ncbi:hypothetical protein TruAng_010386 [Truncatella angustata]|nr:hypothetical protein TruAng_010386 [Truncatella angustata]